MGISNGNEKINLTDTPMSAIAKMSDGNPGAATVLVQMLAEGGKIDPDDFMEGMGAILALDSHAIYGTDIYVLHSDICGKELPKTIAVLRAVQLGFFNESVLQDACSRQDYSGRELVPVDELYEKVKERLPNFNAA